MDKTRWTLVKAIVGQAGEMAPAARAAFLSSACAEDEPLRREVEAILASWDDAPDLFACSVPELAAPLSLDSCNLTGRHVGPYRLTRLIARGGMGAVYEAERSDGVFAQTVAVKLIEHPLLTDESVRRFRVERQTLATLKHPNIAQLHDGGVTEDGLPYLVMEHVEGVPIDTYCDEHRQTVGQRLELFRQVCAAVQHAHGALIVHRDIKPGNILVNTDGLVKLVDFGIARVLEGRSAGAVTVTHQRMLTPMYASPEQIRGEAVTTACDLYALGVVLYELLTGHRPFHLNGASPAEVERTVCETEPLRPSTAIGKATTRASGDASTVPGAEEIARNRSTRLEGLKRRLRGDLDVIILRAMHKDPARRYGSVEQLDEDIRRHLAGLPIRAREDSVSYRLLKFVRRHAVGVGAASAVVLALVIGLVAAAWQANVAARQRDAATTAQRLAQTEARKSERINAFLHSMLASARPDLAEGDDITVREVLARAADVVGSELRDEPEVAAAVHMTLGETYTSLGLYDEARAQLQAAYDLRVKALGVDQLDTAGSLKALAVVDYHTGRFEDAAQRDREALAVFRANYGDSHETVAACLNDLGAIARARGELDEADALGREALDMRRALLDPDHRDIAESLNNVASVAMARGRLDEAQALCREVLEIRTAALGPEHPDTAQAHNNLAVVLTRGGHYDEAVTHLNDALTTYRRLLREDHPVLLSTLGNLCALLVVTGEHERAEGLLEEVLAIQQRTLPPDHPSIANTLWNLGSCKRGLDKQDEAEPLLRRCLAIRRERLADDNPTLAATVCELGLCLQRQHRYKEAEPLLLEGLQRFRRIRGPDHPQTIKAEQWVADFYEVSGRATVESPEQ